MPLPKLSTALVDMPFALAVLTMSMWRPGKLLNPLVLYIIGRDCILLLVVTC